MNCCLPGPEVRPPNEASRQLVKELTYLLYIECALAFVESIFSLWFAIFELF